MADVDKEQKTEEATPRKLRKMRGQGQVPTSPDVAGAATVIAVLSLLAITGQRLTSEVGFFAQRALSLSDADDPLQALRAWGHLLAFEVLPVAGIAALAAIIATTIQTQGLFTLQPLNPQPNRMNPVTGIQKVLPTPKTLTELAKSFLKVLIFGLLVYRGIAEELPRFARLPSTEPRAAAAEVGEAAAWIIAQGVLFLAALAGLDYWVTRRRFLKDAKMAKHEVKEEAKDVDGDPAVKARRRAKQRERAKARTMIQEVADATVVVTNPTHIAVALRYEPDQGDPAPKITAMGTDALALKMRVEARRHGVPILEDRPFARALHGTAKVGQLIPYELYESAARVIAHVMALRARSGASA